MTNSYMEKCPASLTICEMQIKTAMRCHFIPTRKAMIKMT